MPPRIVSRTWPAIVVPVPRRRRGSAGWPVAGASARAARARDARRRARAASTVGRTLSCVDGCRTPARWPRRSARRRSTTRAAARATAVGQALAVADRRRRCSSSTPTCRARTPRICARCSAAMPPGGLALVEAADGTTNALALASPRLFEPLYGPGSADRFRARRGGDVRRSTHAEPRAGRRHGSRISPRSRAGRAAHRGRGRRRSGRRVKVAVLVGRRRRRALPARARSTSSTPLDVAIVATSATTSRCSACTSRPTSTRSSTRLPASPTRSAAGGARTRRGTRSTRCASSAARPGSALGDRDLGLHLVRTQALRAGEPLSAVTARLAAARSGSSRRCCPRPTTALRTWLDTPAGPFPFQEWFVAPRAPRRGRRRALRGRRAGAARARRARGARRGGRRSSIAPSNPYVSIGADPRGRRRSASALERRRGPAVAVSPLIGGRAVKGPADRMLARLAGGTSPAHVAGCYAGLIDALVHRRGRRGRRRAVAELGMRPIVDADADARTPSARRRLAEAVARRGRLRRA